MDTNDDSPLVLIPVIDKDGNTVFEGITEAKLDSIIAELLEAREAKLDPIMAEMLEAEAKEANKLQ